LVLFLPGCSLVEDILNAGLLDERFRAISAMTIETWISPQKLKQFSGFSNKLAEEFQSAPKPPTQISSQVGDILL
jgi:hypothetical protein